MLLFLTGCIFIDNAEHAAFLASLTGGDSRPGDTAPDTAGSVHDSGDTGGDTADSGGDSGDTGDSGPGGWHPGEVLPVTEVGSGLYSSFANARFGATVAVVDYPGFGHAALVSDVGVALQGSLVWAVPLASFAAGDLADAQAVTHGQTPPGANDRGQSLLLAHRAGDGLVTLAVAEPSLSTVQTYIPDAGNAPVADSVMVGASSTDEFGAAISLAADGTVAIGAPGDLPGAVYFTDWPLGAGETATAADLYGTNGRKFIPSSVYASSDARFGAAVAVGPLGPARDTALAIGAPDEPDTASAGNPGGVWFAEEPDSLLQVGGVVSGTQLVHVHGTEVAGQFGAVVVLADVDGDGTGDLVVGAPRAGDSVADSGAVYIYWGDNLPATDTDAAHADVTLHLDVSGARFGSAIAVVPGNPARLCVGAPGWGAGSGDTGAVFVIPGDTLAGGLDLAEVATLAGVEEGGEFGAALSADNEGLLIGAPGPAGGGRYTGGVWWVPIAP